MRRFNPDLLRFLPLLVVATTGAPAVAQDPSPLPGKNAALTAPATDGGIRLVFFGNPLTPDSPASEPYRDPADGILCVSPDVFAGLGVIHIIDEKMGKVTFTTPEGTATTSVELRRPPADFPQKGIFVPVMETVEGLGGKCEWDAATSTLYARSVLRNIELVDGKLVLRATLPIRPTITRLAGERKIVIDVPGAEIGSLPKTPDLTLPGVNAVRTGQFSPDCARIVLDLNESRTMVRAESDRVGPVAALLIETETVPERPKRVATRSTGKPNAGKASAPPTMVQSVAFRNISDQRIQFVVKAGRVPVARPTFGRGRLTLDLLNANLNPEAVAALGDIKHPFLKAVQIAARGNAAVQLVLDLTRIVNYSVKPDVNGNLVLDIGMPRGAGGKLAGKLIVVDAGHGGHDPGARGGGFREKDVALAIAMKVAEALRDSGANVLMTRADDFFIPVNERPRIANRAGADFFLAIHADSGDSNRRVNGSTVYYHAYEPNCRALALSIANRLESGIGIRNNGVKTDFVRFPGRPDGSTGGFGFLRGARMVAALVETGFMSNPRDVSLLVKPEVQTKIAQSIVAGLRDYIEGNPDLDTREIRPEAGEMPPPPLAGPADTDTSGDTAAVPGNSSDTEKETAPEGSDANGTVKSL
ncbi:MAG: N-acetylmuramoyl-L-alanine amidase [Capsulimonadales bacterium]|nr:N-acetylmuramoyl-L-alanine amidase [Capsulimonadales bacterium]